MILIDGVITRWLLTVELGLFRQFCKSHAKLNKYG